MSKQKVSMDDLAIAIAWLESNDGEEGESETCERVANFLRSEFKRRDHAGNVRVAKRFGSTPEYVAEVVAKDRAERGVKVP